MNKEQIERVRRHLGKGGWLELENSDLPCETCGEEFISEKHGDLPTQHVPKFSVDKFAINQLTVEDEYKLFYALSTIKNLNLALVPQWDEIAFKYVHELGYASIKNSPDFTDFTEEEKHAFVKSNILPLFLAMIETNDVGMSKIKTNDKTAMERAKQLRELRDKNVETDSSTS